MGIGVISLKGEMSGECRAVSRGGVYRLVEIGHTRSREGGDSPRMGKWETGASTPGCGKKGARVRGIGGSWGEGKRRSTHK